MPGIVLPEYPYGHQKNEDWAYDKWRQEELEKEEIVLRREIKFRPAFDKRNTDPAKDYGIHGVEIAFYLHGPEGVVQFVIFTNWQLPHVQEEFDNKRPNVEYPYLFHKPMAADLGYHCRKPMYEDQKPLTENCPLLEAKCYYDGSTLNAEDVFKVMLEGGDEAVWEKLEHGYYDMFGSKENGDKQVQVEAP